MLGVERRICDSAQARVGDGSGKVSPEMLARALESHPQLDHEQRLGVEKLLTAGNGLDVVIGQAGTGKSTMLGAARTGWEAAGYEVIGVAIASRTAAELKPAPASRRSPWPGCAWTWPTRPPHTHRPSRGRGRRGLHGGKSLPRPCAAPRRPGRGQGGAGGRLPPDRFHRRRWRSAHPVTRARRRRSSSPPTAARPPSTRPGSVRPWSSSATAKWRRPWTLMPSTSGSP